MSNKGEEAVDENIEPSDHRIAIEDDDNVETDGKLKEEEEMKKEHVMEILTEKRPSVVIAGRPRKMWVYFEMGKAEPYGDEPFEYTPDRNVFVRKVMLVCLSMLLMTAGFTYACYNIEVLHHFMRSKLGLYVFYACWGVELLVTMMIGCSSCIRTPPCNYITISIGYLCYNYICAFITAHYNPHIITCALIATGVTVLICLGLSYTSFDFTSLILVVFVAGIVLMVIGLFITFLKLVLHIHLPIVSIVLVFLITLVIAVGLIIELQMILGGKAVQFSEDEWFLAAYDVYTSIVSMFLNMMYLAGAISDL